MRRTTAAVFFKNSLTRLTGSKMKFLIVFACIVAIVAAVDDHSAKTLHSDAEVNVDNFKYAYEVDNSIKAQQQGSLKDKDNWVVNGEYEYVSPEGEHIKLAYTADESGYHPDPSNPLIHPIPDYILKSIEYINAHPSKDAH